MHDAGLRGVDGRSGVHGAAIVPQQQITRCPVALGPHQMILGRIRPKRREQRLAVFVVQLDNMAGRKFIIAAQE